MSAGSHDLLGGLLRDVSRSFYLTLRVLPGPIRRPIGLAYLLARAADTIADTEAIAKDERLLVLEAFRKRVQQGGVSGPRLGHFHERQASPAERRLLERIEEGFAVLEQLDALDRQRVREVLDIIISGQALDVERFAAASVDAIAALPDDPALDDYTYRVAGCVGEFWTRMCLDHLFRATPSDAAFLMENGVRFGKGLQLVNILRDLASDLRIGRCYLPSEKLKACGLQPADLLNPANEPRMRVLYDGYRQRAAAHLRAGWEYTNRLPWGQMRVRLACAWPILIGAQTLEKLRTAPVLEPNERVKVSRRGVREVMLWSVLIYPWPGRWKRLFQTVGRQN